MNQMKNPQQDVSAHHELNILNPPAVSEIKQVKNTIQLPIVRFDWKVHSMFEY